IDVSRGALYYAGSKYDLAAFKARLAEFEKSPYAHSDFARYSNDYARSVNDPDTFKARLKEFKQSSLNDIAVSIAASWYAGSGN
ncbi:MAG TPA: hypothetical protein VNX40_02790, partial [Mucilaginibacter sp.]|nr:hypothetical protein [Mucilaginibacter sp.]